MSRFPAALDLVLDQLARRREAGYDDWRAAAPALARLQAARPSGAPAKPAREIPGTAETDEPALPDAADPPKGRLQTPTAPSHEPAEPARADLSMAVPLAQGTGDAPAPASVHALNTAPPTAAPEWKSASGETATPAPPTAADTQSDTPPAPTLLPPPPALPDMPASAADDDAPDDSLSLFGDDGPAAPATGSRAGKKTPAPPASKPGTYQPVTDPAQGKGERLAALRACPERLPCAQCPYGAGPHEHVVFGVGNIDAELMFIGEAPGADEDRQGEPFVGKAGQLLNKIITTMGFRREDIYLANVLKCRPDTPGQTFGNRPPTPAEMTSCRPCLFEQIDIIQPKAIVALGATAMRGLLDNAEPMRDLRGRWHDFKGIPVMATYHPSYLLRNQLPSEKRKVWEDLLLVKERLGRPITEKDRSYFLTKG